MLWLIDGYNLMHAAGAIDRKEIRRQSFERKRRRFLNELSERLGPEKSGATTIVFDATTPPADFPLQSVYEGLTLIFAYGDESADARMEVLIAAHSAPKSLTVVSTDRRIRKAAHRRRARVQTADQFLDFLDDLQTAKARIHAPGNREPPHTSATEQPMSDQERSHWIAEFGSLDDAPEAKEALDIDAPLLSDEEITRIQMEIDKEN
jgi:predicted RNA-binding protein with PIN domain